MFLEMCVSVCVGVYIYEMCSKSIKTETEIIKIEINYKSNIHFLQNKTLIPARFFHW